MYQRMLAVALLLLLVVSCSTTAAEAGPDAKPPARGKAPHWDEHRGSEPAWVGPHAVEAAPGREPFADPLHPRSNGQREHGPDAEEPPRTARGVAGSDPSNVAPPDGPDPRKATANLRVEAAKSDPEKATARAGSPERGERLDQDAPADEPKMSAQQTNETDPNAQAEGSMPNAAGPAEQASPGGGSAAPAPDPAPAANPLESHRGWIGGLLNATQRIGEQGHQAQGASAPLISSPLLLLAFGIAVGASGSVLGLRRLTRRAAPLSRAPAAPVAPVRPALPALVDHVARAPFDAIACFQLAVELLKLGVEQDGLRLLDRSIRLNPMLLLQLLQEPAYHPIRDSPNVRRMLSDVKRDYDRRLLTGYV